VRMRTMRDAAERLLDSVADAPDGVGEASIQTVSAAAQVYATLYVGDQLGRLIELLRGGASITRAGDYMGDDAMGISFHNGSDA